jgi:hypothetical protein
MKKVLLYTLAALATSAAVTLCLAAEVKPVALSNKAAGGSSLNQYTPGVTGGKGLNNIGLLVKTCGVVTHVDLTNQFFYIDDGSALLDGTKKPDGTPHVGLRVSYKNLATGNTFTPPSENSKVAITGISSTTGVTIGTETRIIPTLCPRMNEDKAPI